MIIASVSHKSSGSEIPVEILCVEYSQARRCKVATVRTLNGSKVFCRWYGTGWCYSDTEMFPVWMLHGVTVQDQAPAHVAAELELVMV